MSSPIFDQGTGKRYGQKLLDNIFYGVNFKDDRNFRGSYHAIASIINVILVIPQIVVSFISSGSTALIIRLVVAFVVALLYFIFSFLTSKRQAERVKDKISAKDQVFNAVMFCYNTVPMKLVHFLCAFLTPAFFALSQYWNDLRGFPIVFIMMQTSAVLRQIDSSMSKYTPVSHYEPGLSAAVYSAACLGISFASVIAAEVLYCIYPFLLAFGFLPQAVCGLYAYTDMVTKMVQLPVNALMSAFTGAVMIASFVIQPIEAAAGLVLVCLGQFSFWKKTGFKIAVQTLFSAGQLAFAIVVRILKPSLLTTVITKTIDKDILHYIALGISGGYSVVLIITNWITQTKMHKTGRSNVVSTIINYFAYLPGLAIAAICFIEMLQNAGTPSVDYKYLYSFGTQIATGYAFFNPQILLYGTIIGSAITFGITNTEFTCVGVIIGVAIVNTIYRFQQSVRFYYHMQKLAFKHKETGWQRAFYMIRHLLWVYNTIIMLICSALDLPILPIGGTPLLIPNHFHPRSFFVTKQTTSHYKENSQQLDALTAESVERKDDIILYNSTVKNLCGKTSAESKGFRKIIAANPAQIGDVYLMMQGKQVVFLQNLGRNCFGTSSEYQVQALETKETSCHTLERTCLERYFEYVCKENGLNEQFLGTSPMMSGSKVVERTSSQTSNQPKALAPGLKKQPVTLGSNNRNQNQTQNRLPTNIPQLTSSWLPKYQGFTSMNSFDTSEFSLKGLFNSKDILEDVSRTFLGVLSLKLQLNSSITQQYQKETSNQKAEKLLSEINPNCSKQIKIAIKTIMNDVKNQPLDLLCEDDFQKAFENCSKRIKDKSTQDLVQHSFRLAAWYGVQQIPMGDSLPQSMSEIQELLQQAKKIFIGVPNSAEWRQELQSAQNDKLFTISSGPYALQYSLSQVRWHIFRIPSYYYQMVWSSVQADLIVFNSSDDERFSVQSLPACVRNLLCEAAPAPYGYPLIQYGEGTI
ncbi:Pecanex_and transmembrane domain-containing protein [Hexamita inflata]|uniref:Pecanex and transmembrane domain-containing protein n=1 Tax=Hexamita inflata TaxID=28002 RepID=A0AA86QPU0_9EUKA|nr:Pecanex and transmembrane domain-containing protein [Hexamita inflata]